MFPAELQSTYHTSGAASKAVIGRDDELMYAWKFYDSSLGGYSFLFARVLDGLTLASLAARIREQKGSFHLVGMDLCGQGDFLTQLMVNRGLSVCLGHNYRRCLPASAQVDKWDANLMENETWQRIDHWVNENGKPDLIVCAPRGGVSTFWDWGPFMSFPNDLDHQYSREIFFILVKKMTEILAEGGTLLVEFQSATNYIKNWIKQIEILDLLPGNLSVALKDDVSRITKVQPLDNPDILAHKIIKIG